MNKKTAQVLVVVIVVIVLIILGITKNLPDDTPKETIKIGVITDLSSIAAGTYGEPLKKGIDLAMSEIDPDGKKYETLFEDYKVDSKLALPAYSSLKLRGVRIFIVDGSPGINILAPEAKKDGNIIMNPSSFVPTYKDGNPLTCRIAMTTDTYGPAYADLIVNKLEKKNVALLLPNVAAGVALRDSITQNITNVGGKIVDTEMYASDGIDFRTMLTKIKATKPEVLIALNYYKSVNDMLKQIKELGIMASVVSDDWLIGNQALDSIALVEGVTFVGYPFSGDNPMTAKERETAAKYLAKYNIDPKLQGLMGYDLINILDQAITKTGSSEPAMVANYLTAKVQNYDGASGVFSFNSDCEVERDVLYRQVKDGKFVEVK